MARAKKRVVEFVLKVNDGKARVALKKTSKSAKQLAEESKGLSGAVTGANRALGGFAQANAAAIGAIGVGIGVIVAATAAALKYGQALANARNNITDFGARTGLANKQVQAFKLAFEGSGQTLSDADRALKPYIKLLGDLRVGNASATKKFKDFGLSVTDSEGRVVSNQEAVTRLVSRLAEIDDKGERASVAMGILGSSGGKLAQAFGDMNLESFVAQIDATGALSEDAAASAGLWQRAMAQLTLVMDSFSNSLPLGLMAEMIDAFGVGMVAAVASAKQTLEAFKLWFVGTILIITDAVTKGPVAAFERWVKVAVKVAGEINKIPGVGSAAGLAFVGAKQPPQKQTDPFALPDGADRSSVGPTVPSAQDRAAADREAARSAKAAEAQRKRDADAQAKLTAQQVADMQALVALTTTQNTVILPQIVGLGSRPSATSTDAKQAKKDANIAKIDGATSALGVISGGLDSMLVALGPGGALAAGILDVAANGPEIVAGITDGLMAALEGIPVMLTDAIPELIDSLLTEVIPAIRALIVQLPGMFFRMLVKIIKDLGNSLNPFKGNKGRGFLGIKGLAQDFVGSFASGTGFVQRDGTARVHKGERIVPPGASVGQTARSVPGPTINIVINGASLDSDASVQRVIRRLRSALGDRQLGASLTGYA